MRDGWAVLDLFSAAGDEVGTRRRLGRVPPADRTPPPVKHAQYTLKLERACDLLRDRLKRLEDPVWPLSDREKRRLSHQTHRLSRVVEELVYRSKDHEGDYHAA